VSDTTWLEAPWILQAWTAGGKAVPNMEPSGPSSFTKHMLKEGGLFMPRKGPVPKRDILPDPIYNSKLVAKFINKLMYEGKRSVAQSAMYDAFEIIREKTGRDPLEVFEEAIRNAGPVLEVKPRRVGGATYQVPIEVNSHRKTILAIRWIVGFARKRNEKRMSERLAGELMDVANNVGSTAKKKEDTHKMAESNKAFAHYRW
jgi:small subunit ribosomal protein S7